MFVLYYPNRLVGDLSQIAGYQDLSSDPSCPASRPTLKSGRERRPSSRSDGSNAPEEEVSNYRKVIPLPDEVKVNEGDGSVLVLFDQECVAQRFFESKWNKRGCVQLKLLQYRTTKRVRLIMIHEQVKKLHLLIALHYLIIYLFTSEYLGRSLYNV